jgi:hypothetical protein
MRTCFLAAALALTVSGGAMAATQLEQSVSFGLKSHGFTDVDVEALRPSQLAALHHVMNSRKSLGDRIALIRSILGGRNTLRGLLLGHQES